MIQEDTALYKILLCNARSMVSGIVGGVGLILLVSLMLSLHVFAPLTLAPLAFGVGGALMELADRRRKKAVLAGGQSVMGRVSRVDCTHTAKVQTRAVHLAGEDIIYPYTVYFSYKVGKISYTGHSNWHWGYAPAKKGDAIKVFYDKANPGSSVPENL